MIWYISISVICGHSLELNSLLFNSQYTRGFINFRLKSLTQLKHLLARNVVMFQCKYPLKAKPLKGPTWLFLLFLFLRDQPIGILRGLQIGRQFIISYYTLEYMLNIQIFWQHKYKWKLLIETVTKKVKFVLRNKAHHPLKLTCGHISHSHCYHLQASKELINLHTGHQILYNTMTCNIANQNVTR